MSGALGQLGKELYVLKASDRGSRYHEIALAVGVGKRAMYFLRDTLKEIAERRGYGDKLIISVGGSGNAATVSIRLKDAEGRRGAEALIRISSWDSLYQYGGTDILVLKDKRAEILVDHFIGDLLTHYPGNHLTSKIIGELREKHNLDMDNSVVRESMISTIAPKKDEALEI
jgi:hypothetical protein